MLRSRIFLLLGCGLLLTSCASSPIGQSLQKSLEADPRLQTQASPSPIASVTTSPPPNSSPQLPADFPKEIPLYPDRQLQTSQVEEKQVLIKWTSADSSDRVLDFYRKALQTDNWQLLEQPPTANPQAKPNSQDKANSGAESTEAKEPDAPTDAPAKTTQGTLVARRGDLKITITIQPEAATPTRTSFALRYERDRATATPGTGNVSQIPGFSAPGNAGLAGNSANSQPQPSVSPVTFTDLDKAPKELRQSIEDLAKLGILTASGTDKNKTSSLFDPNGVITRREFVRWLVSANNRLQGDRPVRQIRLALETAQPAFQDVPRTDPDFAAIQGLAEAGLIPSPLAGDSTAVVFKPNEPLTRENLVLWKVPLDTRQPLPIATLEAVQQTWGFQDAAKVEPKALRAVLVDFQNGDAANIRRAFGYTTLFQPKKSVTRAEAAAALSYFGYQGEGQSAKDALKPA
jgi:hypothetical protein